MIRVAVIGASGMLGRPVTRALAAAGFEVTALTRDVDRARAHLEGGVRVLPADVRDLASLEAAFAGHDAVYLNLSASAAGGPTGFQTEGGGMRNIVAAARRSGIGRIGYLSAMVADSPSSTWWVVRLWRQAIDELKSSGVPVSIYYASNFMETLPSRHVFGGWLVLPAKGRYRQHWIAAGDFGAQVARDFERAGRDNREYWIQGPEAASYEEAAQRYVRASGRRLRILRLPVSTLAIGGLFSPAIDFDRRLMTTVLDYDEKFQAGATWEALGRPTTTIEMFARMTSP